MHTLWFFFLRKREFSVLLIAAFVAAGVYAVFAIPKESAPEVVVPIGIVTTVFPGASGLDVEELVTNKLEERIADVDNLESLTSSSRDGVSIITAEFDASADIDASIQDLKDAVDEARAELPRDAEDPVVSQVNFADQPILVVSVSANLSPTAFTALGESLEETFKGVPGVSEVSVQGTRPREIQVVLNESALAGYGLTLDAVLASIASANLTLPVGSVETDGVEYAVRYEGKISDVSEIQNIPIGTQGGVVVYLRDVGTVYDGVERATTRSRVSLDRQPAAAALTLSIYKQSGVDVTAVAAEARKKLASLQEPQGLLEGSDVLVVYDLGEEVRGDLGELIRAGLETVALVLLCLFVTIGWRESLVAALSIPLSFVIAFIGLYASGNTINFMSLFSLILAVGILVDSGIVITEAIHTRMRRMGDAEEAARAAIREYAWPLIAGTMTTVAVFFPLFFLSGIVGEFIYSIPFTIIFVLIASIVVALGMVPLLAIYLTKPGSSNQLEEAQETYNKKAQAWYRAKLIAFLENARAQKIFLWGLALTFVLALTLPFTGLLKVIFFPPEDVEYVYIELESVQGTPLAETDVVTRMVEELLYEKPYITSFTTTVGAGSAFTGSGDSGSKYANITVKLNKERTESSAAIAADLRETFAQITNATIRVTEQQNGPPTGAPVVIRFFGDDLEVLGQVLERAEDILSSIEGTRDVTLSTKSNATELVLEVDTERAALRGVQPQAIGQTLRTAVFGVTATTITRNGEDVAVVVRYAIDPLTEDVSEAPAVTLDALRNISVPSMQGDTVLLGSLVTEKLAPAPAVIVHEDQERTESISAYTVEGVTAQEVVAAFKAREAELEIPPDVRIAYGGETEDINRSFAEMGLAFVAGLVLMLAILVLSFNSIRYSLYLLLTVPLSLIGVFVGLTITGLALSFTSLLGVIALSGVIINHAIILMDSMIYYRRNMQPSDTLISVVADASVTRLRPIFLTTITTVIGMVPLSMISDFWSPLAFAIMFGLTFAMILTLLFIPTLFYRNEKRKMK